MLNAFQATQIKRTERGYVHRLEPNSHDRGHVRQICCLNLVQKRKAALYLIELCKISNNVKENYKKMLPTGLITDDNGNTMTQHSFRQFSMQKVKLSKKTQRELDCEKVVEIIKKHGGQLETSYSNLWYMLSETKGESASEMRSAAAYAGMILRELKSQGEIEIEKIDCTRSIIKLIEEK